MTRNSTTAEWLDQVEQALASQGLNVALLALDEFEALDSVMNMDVSTNWASTYKPYNKPGPSLHSAGACK
ncbi:MAG: hypothetical protein ISS49_18475 [Anaerolineae bacterium]|nr:hypothetical protein [Anaerolineae bacterium]